eukprot:6195731-Pleurochrysis_carterae.AAC.2
MQQGMRARIKKVKDRAINKLSSARASTHFNCLCGEDLQGNSFGQTVYPAPNTLSTVECTIEDSVIRKAFQPAMNSPPPNCARTEGHDMMRGSRASQQQLGMAHRMYEQQKVQQKQNLFVLRRHQKQTSALRRACPL